MLWRKHLAEELGKDWSEGRFEIRAEKGLVDPKGNEEVQVTGIKS